MQRDEELDIFRGFAIIWVLFIHCIYWPGYFSSNYVMIIKSFFLIEMPLLFLITGAGNILSNRKRSLGSFYSKRIVRVAIPYWIYALICVLLMQLSFTYLKVEGKVDFISWFLTFGAFSRWSNYPYLTWHLWFIPVFLMIIFIIPLLLKWFNFFKGKLKAIPLLLFIIIVVMLDKYDFRHVGNTYWVYYYSKSITFYSFWIYLGFFYKYLKTIVIKKRFLFATLILSVAITILLFNVDYYSYNMQQNKFPPNFIFLTFNIGAISLFLLVKDLLRKIIELFKLKDLFIKFGKNSYTVYLYQPFAFLIGGMILKLLHLNFHSVDIVGFLFYFSVVLICSNLFINIFQKIESFNFKDCLRVFKI